MAFAYCYQSGQVEIARRLADVPTGTIIFAKGPRDALTRDVETRTRHAYEGDVLLVPGVPEAESPEDAFRAFATWHAWALPGHPYYEAA